MKRIIIICIILTSLALNNYSQDIVKIQTDVCELTLNKSNGDLIGLHWLNPDEEVIKEGQLGENFRLLLPMPDYEANYFYSSEQSVQIEQIENGVICHYNGIQNERQKLQVKVSYKMEVVDKQLRFSIVVDNPTGQPLAEVFYGIIGGQHGLGKRQDNKTLLPHATWNLNAGLFTRFYGGGYGGGNLGVTYGAGGVHYPGYRLSMPWMETYNENLGIGMYYGEHDTIHRISHLYYELRPAEKGNVIGDNWPTENDVPEGEPIGLTIGWLKMPYTTKGVFKSGEVVVQLHQGDWHEGSKIYRAWYDQYYNVMRDATWLRKEHAWQSIIMSNCEDVVKHTFKDLPKLAADAKKYGVTTFEILGWDKGGIDRGFPVYEPDERLGTNADFENALSEIKAMGMHPIIFTNIFFVDTDIPEYDTLYKKYETKGRWADDLYLTGWGEGTMSARLGDTKHMMTMFSPIYPEVQNELMDDYLNLIRSGADALQFDKVMGFKMDFNPLNNLGPDRAMIQGVMDILERTLIEGKEINPDFTIAAETTWDKTFQYVDVSYLRMNNMDMLPVLRYTFPEWTSTIFAENPFDFNIMNNGMRYGLVWAMAPRHYNVSMDDEVYRPLSEYVSELIRIRKKHEDILFLGVFKDTNGAEVNCSENSRYSVFENKEGTKKAVVLVNFDNQEEEFEVIIPESDAKQYELLIPFQESRIIDLGEKILLPAQTCAVIVEK